MIRNTNERSTGSSKRNILLSALPRQLRELFAPARCVDLYVDVVRRATEWPTKDFSIKTLAKFLGFNWRDTHPSGAASIQWFDEVV